MHRKSSRAFWSYSTDIASKQRNLISCYDDAIIRMYWEMLGNKFSKRLHDSSYILIECCIVVWQIKRWSTNYTEDGWGYGNIMTGVFMWTGGAVMIVCTRQKDSHEAGKSTYIWGGIFAGEYVIYKGLRHTCTENSIVSTCPYDDVLELQWGGWQHYVLFYKPLLSLTIYCLRWCTLGEDVCTHGQGCQTVYVDHSTTVHV